VEIEDEEAEMCRKAEHKSRLIDMVFAPMHNQTMAEAFGGGEYGKKQAELLHRIKFDLPLDDLLEKKTPEQPCPAPAEADPTESKLIQPNPANLSNSHPSEPSEAVVERQLKLANSSGLARTKNAAA
jgi:hypothetical protein